MKAVLRFFPAMAMALVCLAGATARAEPRALLVGIDAYPYVLPLEGSVNDARAMRDFAVRYWGFRPEQIKMLTDAQATREAVLEAFRSWLVEGSDAGDPVLFFWSGHGFQQPDRNGDEADHLDETLVGVDTRPDRHGGFQNMISDDEIESLLKRLRGRQVTLVIDACHSGTITRGLMPADGYIKLLRARVPALPAARALHQREVSFVESAPGLVVWSAVSAAQVALVDRETPQPGGVFTHRFLAGVEQKLADRNGNGVVSHAELLDFLQRSSQDYCRRHKPDCRLGLTPTLESDPGRLAQAVAPPRPAPSATPPAEPPTDTLAEELLAHDDPLGIRLEILPASRARVGQEMRFRVTSERPGYLILLDIDAAGQLRQIFPNRYTDAAGKDNRIRAHHPITLPDARYGVVFTAEEPLGRGRLLAVVTEDPVDLSSLLAPHKDLTVIANPGDWLAQITQRLRRTWHDGATNRQTRWGLAIQDYEIYARRP